MLNIALRAVSENCCLSLSVFVCFAHRLCCCVTHKAEVWPGQGTSFTSDSTHIRASHHQACLLWGLEGAPKFGELSEVQGVEL